MSPGWFIFYPIFYISTLLSLVIIALNSKRMRGRFRVDALPLYMGAYLLNVLLLLGPMKTGVPFLVVTTAIMLYVIIRSAKIQVIAITGSPGSGKSTIVNMLYQDAKLDKIELEALLNKVIKDKKGLHAKLTSEFGDEILNEKKEINKKFLYETIVPRDVVLKKFTKTVEFPVLIELIKEMFRLSSKSKNPIAFDAPLLFDFRFMPYLTYPNIVLFVTEPALPVKRIADRDNITIGEASRQVAMTQAQIGNMLRKANMNVNNDADELTLRHKFINDLAPFLL